MLATPSFVQKPSLCFRATDLNELAAASNSPLPHSFLPTTTNPIANIT
jgi:hypothetical protein